MLIKTATISDKGQISIPVSIRNKLNLKRGESLLLVVDKKRIILQKAEDIIKTKEDKEYYKMLDKSLKSWNNNDDKRWDKY
ncbi:MAG TPA: AbrB/MazE/SpoVT family DNA-binding domain-containing protein [archaeon]|jgi:AbrB family looped-hinge helix DNA binding protein|nr:AbrB/MazE/SpoVT family DNA-binding domain-containing protein [archaeon]HPV65990.1 AbrB/MazE/SpoVT family DNA-binding domain-containing protein [archaeon]